MNELLKEILVKLTSAVYLYTAPGNAKPPYIVYGVDGANDLEAGNVHAERADQGTIDLFTKDQGDLGIPEALEAEGVSYYLESTQYEEETGLIHYEWVWEA